VLAYADARRLLASVSSAQRSPVEIGRVVVPTEDRLDPSLSAILAPEALARDGVHGIVVVSEDQNNLHTDLLLRCRLEGFLVLDERSFLEQEAHRVDIDSHPCSWLLSGAGFRRFRRNEGRRRVFDLFLALSLLLITAPLVLLVAAMIKFDSRGPALFRQERVGLRGRSFTLYKFRSMYQDAESGGVPVWASIGDSRVTRVGKFIRYTRIDELPQLLNVIRGEMSFIGPRPERPYFVEKLSAVIQLYNIRHCIKPGITGWAQVNAPYGASIEDAREKLSYDLYYLKYRSWRLDLTILFRTLRVVLQGQGAR